MKLGDPKVVGELMRKRRRELGFTIEQMAQAVGLSPITIMRIELGRVGYIHAKTFKALEVPKVINRMLVVPTAVYESGESRPVIRGPEAAAVLPPAGTTLPPKASSLPVQAPNPPKRPTLAKRTNKPPMRKRLFSWLSSEFNKLSK